LRREWEMRSIHDLSTEEAYQIVSERLGHTLPPLVAVENEDWGRDYVAKVSMFVVAGQWAWFSVGSDIGEGWSRRAAGT
jgi:hypothetical protein